MTAIELLQVIHGLLRHGPLPGIDQVTLTQDDKEAELLIVDNEGQEFIIYSTDIEPDEEYTGP